MGAVGANFPADQLHESEVSAFRQAETESVNRAICARVKVAANAGDDVAQGVLSLVAQNGIARLVVGAAADKRYSRKLTAPTSKTALSVQQQAPTNCSIWFVCKGNLVSTRYYCFFGGGGGSSRSILHYIRDRFHPKLISGHTGSRRQLLAGKAMRREKPQQQVIIWCS
jgi:hypothetical protein